MSKLKRTSLFPASLTLIWTLSGLVGCKARNHRPLPRPRGRERTVSTLSLLDGREYQNRRSVMEALARVQKTAAPQLVVTPFMPFLRFREGQQNDDLGDFRKLAQRKKRLSADRPGRNRNGRDDLFDLRADHSAGGNRREVPQEPSDGGRSANRAGQRAAGFRHPLRQDRGHDHHRFLFPGDRPRSCA